MNQNQKNKEKQHRSIKDDMRENKGKTFVYFLLRALVILVMVAQAFNGNWDNVFLCGLTLILFMIPTFVHKRLHIEMPTTLEVIILLFIFAAEILGEIQEYYLIFEQWDTMLHTINGFLMAAIGFSLIDILNQSENFSMSLSPTFVAIFAFCFSMTIGVLWEFYEFGADVFLHTDMQKDTIIQSISSVVLNPEGRNVAVTIPIESVVVNGELWQYGGYIDIGLIDTMQDLFVNFIGAVVFSFFGLFYIKSRGKGTFVKRFMPKMIKKKSEKQVEEQPQE